MKKFKFRLEKLLEARIAKEDAIKHELAKVITQQNVFRDRQEDLKRMIGDHKERYSAQMKSKSFRVDEIVTFHRFWDHAGKAIEDAQMEIDRLEPKVNEVRRRLTEAVKERKTIEKHKEKKLKEWQNAVRQAEEKEANDINQKLYFRRLYMNQEEAPEEYTHD